MRTARAPTRRRWIDPWTRRRLRGSARCCSGISRRSPMHRCSKRVSASTENTADGHLLLDQLPGHDRVWIAGGGSGHGFKHGPAIGRYMADMIESRRDPEPAFQLAGRPPRQRAVY